MTGDPVVRVAPAKLNLTLAVLGRRPDGYHALHSVVVPLDLADELSVRRASGPEDTLEVAGFDAGPTSANLVLRAFAAARTAVGHAARTFSLAARLEKRIPVAAGLGGGSSDAAAALTAALEQWGVDRDRPDLPDLAADLGSDVPFFLVDGPALIEGRGEQVTPLPAPRGSRLGVLLVTPGLPLSTAAVYAAHAAGRGTISDGAATRRTSEHLALELRAGLRSADLLLRAGVLAAANDLAPAAAIVAPELRPFRRALGRLLGRPVGQSGSGPTLWALYPSRADAGLAAAVVLAAIEAGTLVAPGDAAPFVAATAIAEPGAPPEPQEGSAP